MQSPSPETKKRRDAEFEKDLTEITSESDEYDPTGKTPEQMDAMIAKDHRDVKASRMEANRHSILEDVNAACPAFTCMCHLTAAATQGHRRRSSVMPFKFRGGRWRS